LITFDVDTIVFALPFVSHGAVGWMESRTCRRACVYGGKLAHASSDVALNDVRYRGNMFL